MIYVNLSDFTLTFDKDIDYSGEHYRESALCGIGEESDPTPMGFFMVTHKIVDPGSYYDIQEPFTPGHYGSCVMELNISGPEGKPYGIHGSNKESNYGTAHTRGCITLKDDTLKIVFNHIEKGERVVVWDCPLDKVNLGEIPNWCAIKSWPPKKNSVSYRRNLSCRGVGDA